MIFCKLLVVVASYTVVIKGPMGSGPMGHIKRPWGRAHGPRTHGPTDSWALQGPWGPAGPMGPWALPKQALGPNGAWAQWAPGQNGPGQIGQMCRPGRGYVQMSDSSPLKRHPVAYTPPGGRDHTIGKDGGGPCHHPSWNIFSRKYFLFGPFHILHWDRYTSK